MLDAWLIAVIFLALSFDFINGFHDTANAIATCVSTRVLTPGRAVIMAGVLNFVGALISTTVAVTIGKGIVDPSVVTQQSVVVCALLGAIIWNLATWWIGLPSSSSHALIGGLVGAVIAYGGSRNLHWDGLTKILLSLLISPLLGFVVGISVMVLLMRLLIRVPPARINRWFRQLQILSAALMAGSHGANDAQKSMGIIALALVAGKSQQVVIHPWIILACAVAMALGTSAGGWRIIRTVGTRIINLKPVHGFAAETSAAAVIQVATHFGLPVSTTHVIASAIMGVGASKRLSAVRWGVAGNIVVAWVLTLPVSALLAWGCYSVVAVLT